MVVLKSDAELKAQAEQMGLYADRAHQLMGWPENEFNKKMAMAVEILWHRGALNDRLMALSDRDYLVAMSALLDAVAKGQSPEFQ